MKSCTSFDAKQKNAHKKAKNFGDRLDGYCSVEWENDRSEYR